MSDPLPEGRPEPGLLERRPEVGLLGAPLGAAVTLLAGLGAWPGAAVGLLGYGLLERRARRRRERTSEALGRSYDELRGEQAERVAAARHATLQRLVRGFAHEVNTPLGALSSNHDTIRRALDQLQEILADERVDPDELDQVRKIVSAVDGVQETNDMAVERMEHIVGTLRDFGRPDRASVDRVDLHEGLENTLLLLGHEMGEEIEVERDYGDLPPVECRPDRINQVFLNLLSNAVQAMEGRGTLSLRTRAGEGEVRVSVGDTGVGISSEDLDRIFDPGFTTKGGRTGMGMGLLISRQIVEKHGGRIEVESTRGEGSTFTVTLPVEMQEEAT